MKLVVQDPGYIGYCDASKLGAGGVWLAGTRALSPVVWRVEWPPDIQQNVVSSDNHSGTLTNSDFEMAGMCYRNLTSSSNCGAEAASVGRSIERVLGSSGSGSSLKALRTLRFYSKTMRVSHTRIQAVNKRSARTAPHLQSLQKLVAFCLAARCCLCRFKGHDTLLQCEIFFGEVGGGLC